jgi:hypothetical protein
MGNTPKVPYKEALPAILRILARGDKLTSDRLYAELGNKGSYTTYGAYIRRYEEEHPIADPLPAQLTQPFVTLIDEELARVAREAREEALAQLASARADRETLRQLAESHEEELEEQKARIEELVKNCDVQQGKADALELEVKHLRGMAAAERGESDKARAEAEGCRRTIDLQEGTIKDLREQIAKLREDLDAERELGARAKGVTDSARNRLEDAQIQAKNAQERADRLELEVERERKAAVAERLRSDEQHRLLLEHLASFRVRKSRRTLSHDGHERVSGKGSSDKESQAPHH